MYPEMLMVGGNSYRVLKFRIFGVQGQNSSGRCGHNSHEAEAFPCSM